MTMNEKIEQAAEIAVENLYQYCKQSRDPKGSAYDEGYLDAIDVHGEFLFREGAEYALNHQWISVDDELPKDFIHVFIKTKDDFNEIHYDIDFRTINGWHCCRINETVTHWMNIPEIGGSE